MSSDEKKRDISRAPAPLKPVRGKGFARHASSADDRKPRWNKWRLIPDVKIFEAVALSLDIDPEKLKWNRDGWMAGGYRSRFDESEEFSDRLEIAIRNGRELNISCVNLGDSTKNEIPLAEFASWTLSINWKIPEELGALAVNREQPTQTTGQSDDEAAAALFDGVTCAVLEKMFPADGKWKSWCERAARNGLKVAKIERKKFNPYKAARFFLDQGIKDWDWARCKRVLANNLPERSKDQEFLLTGKLD